MGLIDKEFMYKHMLKTKYTREILCPIVENSFSIYEVLNKLNLKISGGNHSHITKAIRHHSIDTSHFLGKATNRGKTSKRKHTKESFLDALQNGIVFSGTRLRRDLIYFGIKENSCELCSRDEWNGEPIPLEVHHKDENHSNNDIVNLMIVCPNCHAFLHNISFKHIKKEKTKHCLCGKAISNQASKCNKCSNIEKSKKYKQKTKINWPSKEELRRMVVEASLSKVARDLGVSATSVRNHLK